MQSWIDIAGLSMVHVSVEVRFMEVILVAATSSPGFGTSSASATASAIISEAAFATVRVILNVVVDVAIDGLMEFGEM